MAYLSLLDLPPEINLVLLAHLDYLSLLKCRQVCRTLQIIVDESAVLQYIITLANTGSCDNSSQLSSTSEKLSSLCRYKDAWRTLTYTSHTVIPMPIGNLWELYGGVWAHSVNTNRIHFIQLPSQLRDIEQRDWTLSFDFTMRDFTFDPSQDLLVIVKGSGLVEVGENRVLLRSLSAGDKHPSAPESSELHFPSIRDAFHWAYSMRVCGDYVGIMRTTHRPRTSTVP
ncbi:hypothetical protein OF83DRAFT_1108184 [Amylostereum chailletii]|nr:hypothetical protein OF83DRAFT_1108184 [Amylostereum chailletii]